MATFINLFVLIATAAGGLSMLVLIRRNFAHYFIWRKWAQERAEAEANLAMMSVLALSETFSPPPTTPSAYLSYLKGRNEQGELEFPVNSVYYFTVEDRSYYAELATGRYYLNKTINDLDTELDPSMFYRVKRDYIVNRYAVLHYSYWENGKYILTLNTPSNYEIIVPRVRMHEFREWLHRYASPHDSFKTENELKPGKDK